MALIGPVLFSKQFAIDPLLLERAGLLDPILNSDTKLFLDPLLITKSASPFMRADGQPMLEAKFREIIDLIAVSVTPGDAAWKAAHRLLNLDECSETGLGFGGTSTSGSSRPAAVRTTILTTAKEIITLGEKDPNVIPLMGMLESGIGADTISDMTTNLLLPILCKITESFCAANGVPTEAFAGKFGSAKLPLNPLLSRRQPILLVPRDVLRDLPLAADWTDVSRVVFEIEEIRQAVNALLGNFTKASVSERKEALRSVALSSLDVIQEILAAVSGASESYDEQADLDGLYTFRRVLYEDPSRFRGLVTAPIKHDRETLKAVVGQIIDRFRFLVEENNMWELLWAGKQPRNERAAQLLFFAVATVICSANDIDISPETNSGGGPVDFKFSTGYHNRLVVEVKLSKGRVVQGYKNQLESYKAASETKDGIFLLIDVGRMGRKLRDIQKLKELAESSGSEASEIEVIDAKPKLSASLR